VTDRGRSDDIWEKELKKEKRHNKESNRKLIKFLRFRVHGLKFMCLQDILNINPL